MVRIRGLATCGSLFALLSSLACGCSGQAPVNTCISPSVGGTTGIDPCPSTGGAATGGLSGSGGNASGGTSGIKPFPALNFACTVDSDCCVVAFECLNTLWLVTKTQQPLVEAYVSSLSTTMCTSCITPQVQVSCQNRQCVGQVLGAGSLPPSGLNAGHCGKLSLPGTGGAPSLAILAPAVAGAAPDAGATQKAVFRCGDS